MDLLSYLLGKKAGGGGGGEAVLVNKNIDANGTYNASSDNADGYKKVTVAVPNSYGASDEGKVVSNGALVSQGSDTVTENDTYDTTLISEMVVNVPNSYTAADEGKVVDNGALVAQGSDTYTENGTYDTTLVSEVEVNVSGASDAAILFALMEGTASGEVYVESLTKVVVDGVFSGTKSKATTKINLPNVTSIGGNFCYQLPNITEIKMPKLASAPQTSFGYLNSANTSGTVVTALAFPSLKTIGQQAFRNGKFSAFDCLGGSDGSFGSNAFVNTAPLNVFIIRANTVMPLGNINNFDGTCFASGKTGGTLYVPSALISSYQGATNWNIILGYANNQIKAIEGSIYETQYADGTPIS